MKRSIFKMIAKINKVILPSYSKRQLDLSKATKIQLAIIGWRAYITKNAIDRH
ncbi:MAG: SsrA-binding protein [Bacteroidota bacterium]